MRMRNYFILGIAISLAFTSCKKDDNDAAEDPFQAPYSELTVEENKESLEDAGIEMIGEMESMMESDAFSIINNFTGMSDNLMGDGEPSAVMMAPVELTKLIGAEEVSSKEIISGLKSTSEEPGSISEAWDELAGTHEWNPQTEEWDYTAGDDAIIIRFPGLETDLTNTAEYKIYNFSYVDIAEPAYELELGDAEAQLPLTVSASLSYKGTVLITYSFEAAYQPDGIPTSLLTTLGIEKFLFSLEVNHTLNTFIGETFSFKHDSKTLIELHADASGNWSEDNIEKNETEDDVIIENILSKTNAYIQVLNIKVAGAVDVAKLGAKVRELDSEYEDDNSKEYNEAMAEAINASAQLVVIYVDNSKKIADAEAYVYYDDDMYNPGYDIDIRFVFADGSKADSETYFGEGFGDFIDEVNQLIADLNADYDAEIEPIEK